VIAAGVVHQRLTQRFEVLLLFFGNVMLLTVFVWSGERVF